MSPAFLVTSLVIVAIPGTGAIFTLGTGLARGARAAIVAAFGCTLGVVPHMVAAITGLAAVLHASGVAFAIAKYLGVAYLLFMAWSTWRSRGVLSLDTGRAPSGASRIVVSGVTLNLLNPKLTLFFFAFLPQFVPADSNGTTVRMVGLSAVFMLMTFVVFVFYGVAAATLRERVLARPALVRRFQRVLATGFAGLGARLAFERPS